MACCVLKSRNLSGRRKTGAPGSVQNYIQDPTHSLWHLGQNFPAVLFQVVLLEAHLLKHLPIAETAATMPLDLILDMFGTFYFEKGRILQVVDLVNLECSETE